MPNELKTKRFLLGEWRRRKNDDDEDGMSLDGMRTVVSIRIKNFSSERKLKPQDASIRFIFALKSVGCWAK